MKYYITEPIEGLSAKQRADLISQELFYISRPKTVRDKKDVSNRLFQTITNPEGRTVIAVPDENYLIKVHPENDLTVLMLLYPGLNAQEKEGLMAYIRSQESFPFKNIVPSTTVTVDYQYLIDNGFIEEDFI